MENQNWACIRHRFNTILQIYGKYMVFFVFLRTSHKNHTNYLSELMQQLSKIPNQFQREFDSNGAIATQELFSYLTLFAKLTNLLKRSEAFKLYPVVVG
jgi:hypothetical protein